MDWSTLLPEVVSAVAALIVAFLGHSAGSRAVSADVRKLLADARAGHDLKAVQTDIADLKTTLDDVRKAVAEAKPA